VTRDEISKIAQTEACKLHFLEEKHEKSGNKGTLISLLSKNCKYKMIFVHRDSNGWSTMGGGMWLGKLVGKYPNRHV